MSRELPNDKYDWLTPDQLAVYAPYNLGTPMMRNILSKRFFNGLDKAVIKRGKYLLIRADLFEEWIKNNPVK